MKNVFCLIFILFLPLGAFSQKQGQTIVDSLQTELSKVKEDTEKVNVLNSLSREYYTSGSRDTAFSYAQQALKLSEKLNFKKGTATASRYLGNHYSDLSDTINAFEYYRRALNISKEIDDKQGMVNNLRNIGILYAELSDFSNALENCQQALDIAKKNQNYELTITIYKNIGWVAKKFSNYPLALESFQQALSLSEKTGDKQNIATLQYDIGWLYRDLEDLDKALDLLNKSLENFKQLGNEWGATEVLAMIGNVYWNILEFENSIAYYTQSIELSKKINNEQNLAVSYLNIAGVYISISDYSTAKNYLKSASDLNLKLNDKGLETMYHIGMGLLLRNATDSFLVSIDMKPELRYQTMAKHGKLALNLAKEINHPDFRLQALELLIIAYENNGDYKTAYYNLQNQHILKDSLKGESVKEEIIRKEMQHDFEKKADAAKAEQEKKDIRQRNIRNSSFATVGILLLFSLIVLRQRNKVKKEKKRSDTLLLNILPEEVADELKTKGSAEARQFDEVSILFTDFVSFTQTAEKLTPQQLVKELNECFTAFDNIMEKYGLEKIKTIGDAYMAVCGLPAPDPEHAKKTVQAALEIRDFIEQRKKASPLGRFGGAFEIRIGIHSGSVVAGIVGVKKFAYDIWGDTVNTAARMEQSGIPGKVNISETTCQLVKDDFTCEYRGEVEAKNKGKMKMYFVNN